MKKIVSLMLAAVLMFTLVGCGGDDTPTLKDDYTVATVVEEVMTAYPLTMPGEVDATSFKDVFYIDETMYEDYSAYMSMMMPGTDVVALVEAKEGMAESVKESLEKFVEDIKAGAYLPNDIAKIEASEVIVNGNYVFLVMVLDQSDPENPTAGIDGANEIFNESFK